MEHNKEYNGMHLKFTNEKNTFFLYNQIEKEIELNGDKILNSILEVKNSVIGKFGYYVTGRLTETLVEEFFPIWKDFSIYAISTYFGKPMFCTEFGNIVYIYEHLEYLKDLENIEDTK